MVIAPLTCNDAASRGKSLIWRWITGVVLVVASGAWAQGHSGIPEIDSLPLNDWNPSKQRLSYASALAFSLAPGGGQIYGGHPVRGGFLIGMESLLAGLSLFSIYQDIPHWKDQARDALDSADILFAEAAKDPSRFADLDSRRREKIRFARSRMDLASKQSDLANSELAWAAGLHFYGVVDAFEIAYRSRHPELTPRSVRSALYRGLLFPGAGQLYNDRYGKFGMLWMALGASAVSAFSRQEMVTQLNARLRVARAEGGGLATGSEVEDLEKDRTLYRKRRNQYFWGMALFYVYAVLDGMVDAALSDFDAPQRFAFRVSPAAGGGSQATVALEARLPF